MAKKGGRNVSQQRASYLSPSDPLSSIVVVEVVVEVGSSMVEGKITQRFEKPMFCSRSTTTSWISCPQRNMTSSGQLFEGISQTASASRGRKGRYLFQPIPKTFLKLTDEAMHLLFKRTSSSTTYRRLRQSNGTMGSSLSRHNLSNGTPRDSHGP